MPTPLLAPRPVAMGPWMRAAVAPAMVLHGSCDPPGGGGAPALQQHSKQALGLQ